MSLRVSFFHSSRRGNPSSSSSFTTSESSPTVLLSSPYGNGAPNDRVVQEEYAKWRLKFNKGDFDPMRYENFKANFMAVTVRNNMERKRALQNGEPAPSPIALNEFGDCSADEYRMAMGQQQNGSGGARPMRSANSRPAPAQNQGLQPSNTIINTSRINNNNSDRRVEGLANAKTQLRAALQQRTGLESELAQMKQLLEEKKRMLAKATEDEQNCQQRLALREEQKRLLSDRLNNGWEDERGLNNEFY
eukprot:jgi/Psemu1/317706/estExt_fgenesh1_pm.C_230003